MRAAYCAAGSIIPTDESVVYDGIAELSSAEQPKMARAQAFA
jgi:hypothetical protein